MNKLFQQLQTSPPPSSQARSTTSLPSLKSNLNAIQNLLNGGSNPNSLIQNLISQNPKMKDLMNLFNSSGMTPKQFFYNYAKQQGIDPDQFLNS